MSVPNSVEDQKKLANLIKKLAVFEVAKNSMAEASKEIKADIKGLAGKDFDITTHVKAVVDAFTLKQKAQEAVDKAEEACAGVSILTKYFDSNIYDDAEKYIEGA